MLLSCMQKKGKMQSSLCSTGSLCSSTLTVVCVMVLLLYLASLAGSQAPGDGDQACIDLSSHPMYDNYTHPLMDSKDYRVLLSDFNSGVWQKLNLDENNPSRTQTEVYVRSKPM